MEPLNNMVNLRLGHDQVINSTVARALYLPLNAITPMAAYLNRSAQI